MKRIVTLDGPAGVGKSTLAKRVAEALGVAYLDTGAMFRTVALRLGEQGLALDDEETARRVAAMRFTLAGCGGSTVLSCDGNAVGQEIRTEQVGMLAATYAPRAAVRDALKKAQQDLGAAYDLVAEGRDMGTVVFPAAPYKFFLDATPETRAMRRVKQLAESGVVEDVAIVAEQIRQRDALDRGRAIAPLRPAEDAVIIDTSALDIEGVFNAIMGSIR